MKHQNSNTDTIQVLFSKSNDISLKMLVVRHTFYEKSAGVGLWVFGEIILQDNESPRIWLHVSATTCQIIYATCQILMLTCQYHN